MKYYKSVLILAALLVTVSPISKAGGLDDLATRGQRASYLILEAVTPELFDVSTFPEEQYRERIKAFYVAHYQNLLEESSHTDIELRIRNDNGACGQTTHNTRGKVYLSRVECVERLDSVGAMARLLVGEYVHHLDQGDEFADWVKFVVFASYEKQSPDDFASLTKREDPYAFDEHVTLKQVGGNVYFNSDPSNADLFFIDNRGLLRIPAPKKLSDTVELINITQTPVRWDDQKKAFVTVGEWNITGYENRYWGQGLYERYPVWFKRPLNVEVRFLQNTEAVLVTFDMPVRVDTARQDLVMQKVTVSMVRHPQQAVIDAIFKKKTYNRHFH